MKACALGECEGGIGGLSMYGDDVIGPLGVLRTGPDGGLPCGCKSLGGGRVGWGPSLYGGRPGVPPYG